jgi:antitoxin PrlF
MMKRRKEAACCGAPSRCKVEALVTMDARGQIVLPKDVRDKAGIEAGDKLAVISFESDGRVCCISLVKSDAFAETVKGLLGPMMSEILKH